MKGLIVFFLELQDISLKANSSISTSMKVEVHLLWDTKAIITFCWLQQWHTISIQLKGDVLLIWCKWVIKLLRLVKYTLVRIAIMYIFYICHIFLFTKKLIIQAFPNTSSLTKIRLLNAKQVVLYRWFILHAQKY